MIEDILPKIQKEFYKYVILSYNPNLEVEFFEFTLCSYLRGLQKI